MTSELRGQVVRPNLILVFLPLPNSYGRYQMTPHSTSTLIFIMMKRERSDDGRQGQEQKVLRPDRPEGAQAHQRQANHKL